MADRKSKTEVIDGVELVIVQHKPMDALRFNALLVKAIGPSIGRVLPAFVTGKVKLEDVSFDELGDAIALVDPDLLAKSAMEALRCTEAIINGKRVELNGEEERINFVFAGQYTTMLKAAWAAIKHNFADFTALVPVGAAVTRAGQIQTPSTSGSTPTT